MPDEGDDLHEGAEELAQSYGKLVEQHGAEDPGYENPPAGPADEPAAPPPLHRIIEAMLFVGGPPLTAERACESIRGLTAAQFAQCLDQLNRDYRQQGRPYRVQPREHGFELLLLPRYRPVLDRLYGSTREARLSPQALDVLALVAYRQPVTRQEVESLRGGESSGVLRQLVRYGLIAVQRGEGSKGEVCYGTTARFLQLFQLRSLDDLPRTQDLQRL
jgi:segregation and condensation protein B